MAQASPPSSVITTARVDPSGGDLRLFGFDPARDARRIKERIGVVPQENALDEELTVLENMRLYARFQSVKDPLRRSKNCWSTCRWSTKAMRRFDRSPVE